MLRLCLAVLLSLAALPACSQSSTNRDPAAARLVFDDVPRFWQAWERARDAADAGARGAIYDAEYLGPGTAGLREFQRLRIGDGARLAATVDAHPRYYAGLRAATARAHEHVPKIREALAALAMQYPGAVFPDVYFVVGRMNSGGTLSDTGLLIGLDMYGLADATPREELGDWHRAVLKPVEGLPHIVAHELVHYQQRYAGAKGEGTLLAIAINEGVADFVAERISGAHVNGHVHAWAAPREAGLWSEFRAHMHGSETRGWIYDTEPGGGRPADLGYFIGYRIAQCHYHKADDPREALRELFTIEDFPAFLAASGYDGTPCTGA